MVGEYCSEPGFDVCLVTIWHDCSHCLSRYLCQKDLWLQLRSPGRRHQCNSSQSYWESCNVLMWLQRFSYLWKQSAYEHAMSSGQSPVCPLLQIALKSLVSINFNRDLRGFFLVDCSVCGGGVVVVCFCVGFFF